MTVKDIINFSDTIAPFSLKEEWDNIGLLSGDEDSLVSKILVSLDITVEVIEEAREKGCGMIIAHHPVIFDPLYALTPDTPPYLLAKYDIAALCLHTNLDRAACGVNTCLAEAIGLQNTVLYAEDFLCVGELSSPLSADDFAVLLKDRLHSPDIRYTPSVKSIRTVAVSSGGGGEGIRLYRKYGFDAFVTGELKHHQYLFASERGIAAFDAGHFSTEDIVIEPLITRLEAAFPDLTFIKSEICGCPYRTV